MEPNSETPESIQNENEAKAFASALMANTLANMPEQTSVETHADALQRLALALAPDENERLNAAWADQSDARIKGNTHLQEKATEAEAKVYRSVAFRLASEALALAKSLEDNGEDGSAVFAAGEWLVAKCKSGFDADEQHEFFQLCVNAR